MSTMLTTLTASGMEEKTAEIYLILANHGEQTVPQILERTSLSRASVYDVLPELLASGYAEYRKDGRVAYYKPTHPNTLFGLLEQKKRDVKLLEGELSETIRALTGSYNVFSKRPGIRHFEGIAGIREALMDSLTTNSEIYTFVESQIASTSPEAIAVNEEYIAERIKKRIPKKIITTTSKESLLHTQTQRQRDHITQIKYIDANKYPFHTAVQIYGDSVSYISLQKDMYSAYIIHNPMTAGLHRSIFRFMWDQLSSEEDLTEATISARSKP